MNLIQTKDYLLLIDEEAEIKMNDYCVNLDNRISHLPIEVETRNIGGYGSDKYYWSHKKCLAYYPLTKEAKELDLPLLPPFEEDKGLEKSLNKYIKDLHSQEECIGFIAGYKATQSKQYSLEDIKKAIQMARRGICSGGEFDLNALYGLDDLQEVNHKYSDTEIIQSLSTQQLPKEFVPQYNIHMEAMDMPRIHIQKAVKTLKTITNSKGKEVLVGTYKY